MKPHCDYGIMQEKVSSPSTASFESGDMSLLMSSCSKNLIMANTNLFFLGASASAIIKLDRDIKHIIQNNLIKATKSYIFHLFRFLSCVPWVLTKLKQGDQRLISVWCQSPKKKMPVWNQQF